MRINAPRDVFNKRCRKALRRYKGSWSHRLEWYMKQQQDRLFALEEAAFTLAPTMKEPRPSPSP